MAAAVQTASVKELPHGDTNNAAISGHGNTAASGLSGDAAAHGENDGDEDPAASDELAEIPIRVDPLLQQNASPIDIDRGLRLIQLCRDGDLAAVKTHIGERSPAGFISKTGWTPLAAAAYSGKSDILLYLLDIGADTMYKTSKRNSIATSAGGDNLHIPTGGNSAQGHSDAQAKRAGKKNCGMNTPLHWASYKGHLDVLSILLHAGYSIEDVDPIGNRCLHLACSGGHREVVELLLANSASVDQKNLYGNRPLDLATEPNCRKLLLKFQSQTTCEWCKEAFTRIRRPSLCQHCHNIYCDARPCSSYSETASPSVPSRGGETAGTSKLIKSMRSCQDCATEMGKSEQELRTVLDSKLELIRHTLGLLGSKSGSSLSGRSKASEASDEKRPGSDQRSGSRKNSESGASGSIPNGDGSSLGLLTPDAPNEAIATPPDGEGLLLSEESSGTAMAPDSVDSSVDTPVSSGRSPDSLGGSLDRSPSTASLPNGATNKRILLSNDEISRVLTLSQTDAEALYTAIEAAQIKAADHGLIQFAKRTYHQLIAHVALQEEIKSLMLVRPIGIRSLIEPLKSALQHARREQVSEPMLRLAIQVIQSAEAECMLFGCNALCEKIQLGSKKHCKDIARLEASINEAQALGVNDKLLGSAVALQGRLNAEIMLEECLLPFTPKLAVSETGAEVTHYEFSDGTLGQSLLQALELRFQKITSAVELGSTIEGVSTALLDEGTNFLKQLKKDIREETKNEEERRRLEEEAALKAAKKGKKKKV